MFEQAGFEVPELEMSLAFAEGDGRTGNDGSQDPQAPRPAMALDGDESDAHEQPELTNALANELGVDTYA